MAPWQTRRNKMFWVVLMSSSPKIRSSFSASLHVLTVTRYVHVDLSKVRQRLTLFIWLTDRMIFFLPGQGIVPSLESRHQIGRIGFGSGRRRVARRAFGQDRQKNRSPSVCRWWFDRRMWWHVQSPRRRSVERTLGKFEFKQVRNKQTSDQRECRTTLTVLTFSSSQYLKHPSFLLHYTFCISISF